MRMNVHPPFLGLQGEDYRLGREWGESGEGVSGKLVSVGSEFRESGERVGIEWG